MNYDRPKIDIPKSMAAKLFDGFTVAAFAAAIVYLALQWNELPEKIPAHFGASGEVDRWGSRFELFLLPGIAAVMWAGLTLLEKYPHVYNYMNLTPENTETQYRYGKLFMNVTKNLTTLLLVSTMWDTVRIALGFSDSLNPFLFYGLLGALFAVMAFYFWKVFRL